MLVGSVFANRGVDWGIGFSPYKIYLNEAYNFRSAVHCARTKNLRDRQTELTKRGMAILR